MKLHLFEDNYRTPAYWKENFADDLENEMVRQLQDPYSIPYLKENLTDHLENEMLRLEYAEAMVAIATEECIDISNGYANDDKRVVKESCIIALDICEYENSPVLQYAVFV
ncbi:hypothetical protein DOY81_009954 [Sarcophaga bullata]|nr:hypothetical protein DOY81_009954 [Sarcophaga bullata]